MDRKVPVVGTAVEAFVFGFRELGNVIRVGWFPLLVTIALFAGGVVSLGTGMEGLAEHLKEIEAELEREFEEFEREMEELDERVDEFEEYELDLSDSVSAKFRTAVKTIAALPWPSIEAGDAATAQMMIFGGFSAGIILMFLAFFALTPVVTVIYEVSAGRRSWPSGFLYFRFGGRELRTIAGSYILGVLIQAFVLGIAGPIILFVLLGVSTMNEVVAVTTIVLGYLTFILATIWVSLRTIAIVPAIAAENRLIFIEAFKATRGNAWRIFFSLVVFSVLLALLYGVFMIAFVAVSALGAVLPEGGQVVFGILLAGLAAVAYVIILSMELAFGGLIWRAVRGNVMEDDDLPPAEAAVADALDEFEEQEFGGEAVEEAPAEPAELDEVAEEPSAEAPDYDYAEQTARRDFVDRAPPRRFLEDIPTDEARTPQREGDRRSIDFVRRRFR
ncbi:hypothetical protein [Parvularcula lutaonensis]|uniref:Glycerophosphoryl diester phosphodiesterase membrane domain-containing protein n=1 Tax=Parvularcula lutaonensis TaxID=491923 RepID=A0ABV7MEC7_9PROT|nr:hypothetical protein [Parvularcula lutaonensis]